MLITVHFRINQCFSRRMICSDWCVSLSASDYSGFVPGGRTESAERHTSCSVTNYDRTSITVLLLSHTQKNTPTALNVHHKQSQRRFRLIKCDWGALNKLLLFTRWRQGAYNVNLQKSNSSGGVGDLRAGGFFSPEETWDWAASDFRFSPRSQASTRLPLPNSGASSVLLMKGFLKICRKEQRSSGGIFHEWPSRCLRFIVKR